MNIKDIDLTELENFDLMELLTLVKKEISNRDIPHKVVYNAKYGGFSLSKAAYDMLHELGAIPDDEYHRRTDDWTDGSPEFFYPNLERDDIRLVQVVETLKEKADGHCAKLKVITICSEHYKIKDYDGFESVDYD